MVRPKYFGLLPLLALLAVSAVGSSKPQAANKVKLTLKATVGESLRRQSDVMVKIEAAGQKVDLEQKETVLVTIKAVDPDGAITSLHKTESLDMTVNGEKTQQEQLGEDTIKESAQGRLISYSESGDKDEQDATHLNERLYQASEVVFSDQPVGAGDKWTVNFDANSKLGTPAAKADFKLVGLEAVEGVSTAKIEMDYNETDGKEKIHYHATQWVEVSSGDNVRSEFKAEGIPFGGGEVPVSASATGTGKRLTGSPLKGAQGVKANDPNAAPPKEEEDNIDKKMKDYVKAPGLFTMYSRTKDSRQQIFMEIPEALLDKPIMVQATASTGTGDGRVVAGDPLTDTVFSFRRIQGDKLYMVVPNPSVRASGSPEEQRSIDRSFPESYIDSYRIEAKQADRKSVLIDVSGLFVSDFSQIGQAMMGQGLPMMGGGGFQPDRERSFVSTVKSFPTNVYMETTYVFPGRAMGGGLGGTNYSGDPRGTVIKVDWNVYALPTGDGYRPRMYDPRVGFFTADYLDFGKDTTTEKNTQWILRWNLKKKDPTAAISEPVKPITFWLDNAIPVEWRSAVSDGILNWNKAFEAIGYKDAIVVKQMPDKADFDHADMRYNVVRWVSSPDSAYAVSLFRPNPFTGEMLNASITVDSNMVRFSSDEHRDFATNISDLLAHHGPAAQPAAPVAANIKSLLRCDYGQMARTNMAEGALMLDVMADAAQTPISRSEYVKQFLREVVCHEMGHILGLRHNFAGSTESSLTQLSDPAWVAAHGNSASVMDYLPFNIGAFKNPKSTFYSQTIGVYDKWAIEYGYKDIPALDSNDEKHGLQAIASKTNEPGHIYMGDEFADGVDPYVTRFDSGKEPMDYDIAKADMTQDLLMKLGDKYPKVGESYYTFANAFYTLLNSHLNAAISSAFFVGGVRKFPNFHGDANERAPIVEVSPDQQRRGLDTVLKYIFSKDSFNYPKRYYTYLAKDPQVSYQDDASNAYDFLSTFEGVQRAGMSYLLSPIMLDRLREQEFKAQEPTLTAREIMDKITDAVWSELKDGSDVTQLRSTLQDSEIDSLLNLAMDQRGSVSAPLRTMARGKLERLDVQLKAVAPKATGDTKAHYEDEAMRIDKAMAAVPLVIHP